jgi:hypothetical protein
MFLENFNFKLNTHCMIGDQTNYTDTMIVELKNESGSLTLSKLKVE